MPSEKDVMQALDGVPGPDGASSLVQSGAIVGVSIRDSKIYVSILVDPAKREAGEAVRRQAEAKLRALPGAAGAMVSLTAERPESSDAPSSAPGPRAQAARARVNIPGVERIIAVASGKGGVGKSTVAANLAVALSRRGWKIGFLDADIYGPSAPRLFGLRDKPQVRNQRLAPLEAHGLKVMSIGFMVDEEAAMIWRGPMVMSALNQLLRDVDWGELDCLVVDMPPGTGDAQLTLAQSTSLAGAVIVSTPQDLALIDARRGVAMFRKVDVPILGVVENMSYFACPHCGERTDLFGHGGARSEAARQGVPFLGEAPLALPIREWADAGTPIVAADPEGPYAAAFFAIADAVKLRLTDPQQGQRPAPRIVLD